MSVKIFHSCNSALCFKTEKSKIIIDGIYCSDDSIKKVGMSPMSEEYQSMIKNESGAFCSPDIIAFTHTHTDHYDEKEIDEYLVKNKNIGYFSPCSCKNNVITEKIEETEIIKLKDFELIALPIGHLVVGDIVEDVPNCSFILKYEQANYFIGGDSHLTPEMYDKYYSFLDCHIKYAFLNAVQVASPEGQDFIRKMNPEALIIVHLPDKNDDIFNYYNIVRSFERRRPEDMPRHIVAAHMEWIDV